MARQREKIALGIPEDLYVMIPKGQYKDLRAQVRLNSIITAPVQRGNSYGNIRVALNNKVLATQPLVALTNNPKGNVWNRINDTVSMSINKFFNKNAQEPAVQ